MRAVVVQHSFGAPGTGGPIGGLNRLLDSPLSDKYEFVRMHQEQGAGGIDHRLVRRWVAMLREVRPDLVHIRGLGNEGFHGAVAAHLAGVPAILVSIHGTVRDLTASGRSVRRELLVRAVEPLTLSMATDVVTVCRATAERSFLDPWRRKLRGVVPNGIGPMPPSGPADRSTTRAALQIGEEKVVLVVVGRLSHEKGHAVLAEAAHMLPPDVLERVSLLLVGDGPDRVAIIQGYEAVPNLEIKPVGLRHDVATILQASDVFVFPTFHENLSNALLEGMSAGLPVVASSVGGNVEVLMHGGGLLVPPRDARELARALTEFVRDADRRLSTGRQALEVVTGSYSLDQMVAGWDAVYSDILRKASSR